MDEGPPATIGSLLNLALNAIGSGNYTDDEAAICIIGTLAACGYIIRKGPLSDTEDEMATRAGKLYGIPPSRGY